MIKEDVKNSKDSKEFTSLLLLAQVDKVKNPRGVCGFLSRGGGVNISNQRGVTPPLTPKKFSPVAATIFYSTFFR